MACGHDPRGPVHAYPVVAAVLRYHGLACVHSHSHTQRGTVGPCVRGQRALCVRGGNGCIMRSRKDVERGISLRVDLLAAVRRESLAQQALMLRENHAIAITELL